MTTEMKDVQKKLPQGAEVKHDAKRREAVIHAPRGQVWVHNNLKILTYCQPTDDRHQLYKDMISDVSRGTYKPESVKKAL